MLENGGRHASLLEPAKDVRGAGPLRRCWPPVGEWSYVTNYWDGHQRYWDGHQRTAGAT